MKYISTYFDQDLTRDIYKSRAISMVAVFVGTFCLGIYFNKEGIFDINPMQSLFLATLLSFLIFIVLHNVYKNRRFVAGLEFNDEKKVLKIFTRNICSENISEYDVHYDELSYTKKRMCDGIKTDVYDSFRLSSGSKFIGVFYLYHEMWDECEPYDVDEKLLNLLNIAPENT
jgi:hypothetical protein